MLEAVGQVTTPDSAPALQPRAIRTGRRFADPKLSTSNQSFLAPRLLSLGPLYAGGVDERNLRLLALEQLGQRDDLEPGIGRPKPSSNRPTAAASVSIGRVGNAALMKTPIGAFSRSMALWRSRIMLTETLLPPFTETSAFSVRLPSGLK